MKLVKQVLLAFQKGTSDKIYEVDLCEVSGMGSEPTQYVVNFRYGRRGAALRDGTKTAAPVSREQAQKLFEDLVASKVRKGYQYAAGSDRVEGVEPQEAGAAPEAPPTIAGAEALDPRAQAVVERLKDGHVSASGWKLSRAVWRAGELGLKEAEPLLLGLIGSGDSSDESGALSMLDYCICAALCRCGSPGSIDPMKRLMADQGSPPMVRSMAAEALLQLLGDGQRSEAVQQIIGELPESLVESARNGPANVFEEKLKTYLGDGGNRGVLLALYRIDNEHVRPALIETLRTAPLQIDWFQWLRQIFKVAELRRDGEVFGVLARRFETTRSRFRNRSYSYYGEPAQKRTIGPNAESAFSHETRSLPSSPGMANPEAARRIG